jgi:hypothetical protein
MQHDVALVTTVARGGAMCEVAKVVCMTRGGEAKHVIRTR